MSQSPDLQSDLVSEKAQSLSAEPLLTLFEIDLTRYGMGIGRFCNETLPDGGLISWGGNVYAPLPCAASGFERSGSGQAARPTISLGNANAAISALILGNDDLVGCEVRRIRIFRDALDDGGFPSIDDHFPVEIYRVERKAGQNKNLVSFELANVLDQEGTKLPRRQMVRDYCSRVYRVWTGTDWRIDDFDPCPYSGTAYYSNKGASVTDPALDKCGKHLADCQLRFGTNQALPTRAFPGLSRYAV